MSAIIPKPENLAKLVFVVRGEKVLLDADLADLYGVATKVLNQAVKRNLERFPADFMFHLTPEEWERMRSQTVTSSRRKLTAIPYAFEAMETRYDEQFSQVFDAIKQLITDDNKRKAKPPIGFL